MRLGTIGVWAAQLRSRDRSKIKNIAETLEQLGVARALPAQPGPQRWLHPGRLPHLKPGSWPASYCLEYANGRTAMIPPHNPFPA